MALSEYEKTEFNRITTGLHFGDSVALSEMEGLEQENTSEHIIFPKINPRTAQAICSVLLVTIAALLPVAIHFVLAESMMLAVATIVGMVLSYGVVLSFAERIW